MYILLELSILILITICPLDYGTVPTTHLFSKFFIPQFEFFLIRSILINFQIIYIYIISVPVTQVVIPSSVNGILQFPEECKAGYRN